MPKPTPIPTSKLKRACDPDVFGFNSTEEIEPSSEILGQDRAITAIAFGLGIPEQGYNIFASGSVGVGKYATVRRYAEARAKSTQPANDWCHVFNFQDPDRPRTLHLPAGRAQQLRADLDGFVRDLMTALSVAFESEEFRLREQVITEEFEERERDGLHKLEQEARSRTLGMHRTPNGLIFVPLNAEGEPIDPSGWKAVPADQRARVEADVEEMQEQSKDLFLLVPSWQREIRLRMRDLRQEVTQFTVTRLMEELRSQFSDLPRVLTFFDDIESDVVVQSGEIAGTEDPKAPQLVTYAGAFARRYRVNILSTGSPDGAPVVYEENPSFPNLVGRIEYQTVEGGLVADFNLIKPGALHRANGGFLILDAHKLLGQPGAWDGLKRALKYRRIRIESLGQPTGPVSSITLDPEPIPLDVKVILIGDRNLYYLLLQQDPEFDDLFKVVADFEDDLDWTRPNVRSYGRLLGEMGRSHGLMPFDKTAIARLTEHGARLAGSAHKLTTQYQALQDVMREANYLGMTRGDKKVDADQVDAALEARRTRSGRIPDRLRDNVVDGTILIDTKGMRVGQINGLSVSQIGGTAFGRPARITAQVRMGSGDVVDIEREVALSGPSHSKGVLILSSFLAGRFASDHPLSLSASLVFEQSYGGVDGDSASSAELYALLSAIAEIPIDQSFAVTGSVNQYGDVQAIGGANEKIEGFFDLCKERKLTGRQGVLIPASNVRDLMLKTEIIEAAEAGQFRIYPIKTIDQGIEILTGVTAGQRGRNGLYPEGSVNRKVQDRLEHLAVKRSAFLRGQEGGQ